MADQSNLAPKVKQCPKGERERIGNVQENAQDPSELSREDSEVETDMNSAVVIRDKNGPDRLGHSVLSHHEEDGVSTPRVSIGVGTHRDFAESMAKALADSPDDQVRRTVILPEQVRDAQPLGGKNRPVPDDLSAERHLLPGEVVCSHCHKTGHTLSYCIGPAHNIWGDIAGCPMCNVKTHNFDECHHVIEAKSNDDQAELDRLINEYLILRRSGKPLIRSNVKVFTICNEKLQNAVAPLVLPPGGLPWRREISRAYHDRSALGEVVREVYDMYDSTNGYRNPIWPDMSKREHIIAYQRDGSFDQATQLHNQYTRE
ncbi:hypothetical protein F5Y18DRAFT_431204 [Xylariaceae sp. FL1019]|nr:hypothetical protein F5Y18DRAFT_431204 [Xylariaceae sp. FL1019]